jgi:hypothetical protein
LDALKLDNLIEEEEEVIFLVVFCDDNNVEVVCVSSLETDWSPYCATPRQLAFKTKESQMDDELF